MNSSSGSNVNRSNKTNQNIQVYVRVRPLNARERGIRSMEVVDVASPKEIIVHQFPESKMTKKFTFDRTFGPESNQSDVYQTVVAPLIEEVLAGYNCTVFAYGQTGTGKTHTMIGTECPELKSSWDDNSMIGIIPRALSHLFDELRMMEVEFSMRISYLELYNEELCDLLSSDDSTKIRIFDDANKKGSVIVQGLEEIPVHSKDDVYKLLEKGQERRKTATTLMNAQSSRSHTVFSILVHIKENGIDGEEMLKLGKLNLVDLAGSENISKAGNEKGIRSRETVNINQSLLTLGRVITALVERTPHIPYRESKLTRLLQESLGGRTKTSIIATISPGHKDLEETLSTLEYAHRAKNIQNKPELNQKLTKKTVLKEYTEEIDRLKRDLMAARDKNGIYLAEETYNDMQYKLDSQNRELTEKMLLIKALKDDLSNKEKIFNEVSLNLVEKTEELIKKDKNLLETQTELNQTKRVLTNTKKRYKEKKVLLESHVKTEQELTSQATKLIEVADIASTDTIHLHSSLERRKELENKNQTAFQQLSGKMRNTFEMMNESVENLNKEHNVHSQIMMDDISNSQKLHKILSTKIVDKIETISKNQNITIENFSSYVEKHSKELDEVFVIHKTTFNSIIQELEKREEEKKTNLEKYLNEIKSIIQQQNILLTNTYAKIKELTDANMKSHEKYLSQSQEKLKTIANMVTNQLNEKKNNFTASIKRTEFICKKRQNLLDNLTNLMEEFKNLQNNDTAEIEHLKEISEFETITKPFTEDVNNEIQYVENFINEISNESEEQTNTLTDFKNEMNTMSENCLENINSSNVIVSDSLIENKDKVKEILEVFEKYGDNVKGVGGIHKKNVITAKENAIKQMDTEIKQSLEIINDEYSRLDEFHTQNIAVTISLKNSVKDYIKTYKRHINECNHHMENFQKSELKTYSPTGLTPSKKEFSYPRILAATSPHNLIIKRFRFENDWSDLDTSATITEDSEPTPTEISNSDLLINSTPIKCEVDMKQFQSLITQNGQNSLNIPQNLKSNTSISPSSSRKNSPALFFDKENKENSCS